MPLKLASSCSTIPKNNVSDRVVNSVIPSVDMEMLGITVSLTSGHHP